MAKMNPKSDFWDVFFRLFFDSGLVEIFGRFSGVFLRADLQNSCAHTVFC